MFEGKAGIPLGGKPTGAESKGDWNERQYIDL
jgi:hypothetical protein